jgi:hypothetical protein
MRRLVALLVGSLAVTGCGAAPMAEQASREANTARIVVAVDSEPAVLLDGTFDLESGAGVVDADGERPRTIYAPDAVYELIPNDLTIGTQPKKLWLKSPRSHWSPLLLDPLANTPAELLALFESLRAVTETGSGVERGIKVSRSSGTLDIDAYLARLTPEARAQVVERLEDFDESLADWRGYEITVLVARDADGRLRRADLALYEDEMTTIEVFDYGVEVDATPPPERETMTWEEYQKLLAEECEKLKKKGLEKTRPHCFRCGAAEGEGEA